MPISTRVALAAGLSLVGLVGLASGQQQDRAVQKTNATAPAAPRAIPPAVVGTVDIEAVFKGYEKVKATGEVYKAEFTSKYQELTRIAADGKAAQEKLANLDPKQPDYKKTEEIIARCKAELQIKQEQARNEMAQKESESLASLYKEIQAMVGAVAKQRNLTYVVKISKEPIDPNEPDMVMAAMARTVVYSDPATDITNDVVAYLNHNYKKSLAAQPGAATAVAPAAAPSATR